MKALLRFTLAQTVLFNVVFVLLMVVGAYAILAVPVERYPAVKMGQVSIQAFYPGASPEEVEALVTREIEDALENLDNLDFIKSTSNRERCRIVSPNTPSAQTQSDDSSDFTLSFWFCFNFSKQH